MSFTSVLPTPQILLKAKLAPAGPSIYGYILRLVKKGDIILPDDQNNLVYAWRAKIDKLSEIESVLRSVNPSWADALAAYISELKSILDTMPIVKDGDWVYSDHFNLHLRALRKLIEIEEWLTTEVCGSPSEMVQLLDAMKNYAGQLSEKKTWDIVASADWNTLKQALGFAPRLNELASMFAVPTVYLFKENDWSTAKQYVTDNSIIICWMTIPTLTPDEVRQLVASKKVVFVIEVDTQPYYPYSAPAWYGVFYTVLAPRSCGMCASNVTDPDFQRFLGSSVPCLFDYNVGLSQKVSGAKNWSGDSCGWGYKRYEQGAIIEVPYDGYWEDADWLGKYVDAISNILLGVSRPAGVLYLGHYITGAPDWHACNPIDNCWTALAQARGWRVVDLRA
jgi:hypothetical protein